MPAVYQVEAFWEDQTGRWTAISNDIPGLVCEAESFKDLQQAVKELAPILLEMNGGLIPHPLPINIHSNYSLVAAE